MTAREEVAASDKRKDKLAEIVPYEMETDGTTRRKEGEEEQEDEDEIFTDSDEEDSSVKGKEEPWPLDEVAEEGYRAAAALFYQRYHDFLENRGMCYLVLDKFDREEIGEAGSRLFRALVKSFTNDRRNQRRRFTRRLARESLKKKERKRKKVESKPTGAKRVIVRTQVSKKVRQLLSKLTYIQRGNKKATIFTSADLADLIRLTSTRSNKKGIAKIMELFLELAPKIEQTWHANVLKRFKEPHLQPFITPEMLEAAQHWLETRSEWKQKRTSIREKVLRRL